MLNEIFTPAFYIAITIICIIIGWRIEVRVKNPIVNRSIIAMVLLILFAVLTDTTYEEYMTGGTYISLFLGPATVALALPLYNQLKMIIKHKFVVLVSILCGVLTCFVSVFLLVKLLGLSSEIYLSTLPKSVTMPVAFGLSSIVGGVETLTMLAVTIAGVMGAAFLPGIAKLIKINDRVALGIAIGTTSHALGTARAIEIGEVEGAFSSLSISVTAIMTVIIVPVLVNFTVI